MPLKGQMQKMTECNKGTVEFNSNNLGCVR